MESVALSVPDAREALLALRLLPEIEADLTECRTAGADRAAALVACRTELAGREPATVETEGWADRWLGRAGWLLSGVAIGVGVGLVVGLVR